MNRINCTHHRKCLLPTKSTASVRLNEIEFCYEAWNAATDEERAWFEKATGMYAKGLLTQQEFSDSIMMICGHRFDSTLPIRI